MRPSLFMGLLATQAAQADEVFEASSRSPERINAWQCQGCDDLHEDESEAAACCPPPSPEEQKKRCPICNQDANDFRDAADCCLWKDFDAFTRWRMADRVEAGAEWADVLKPH